MTDETNYATKSAKEIFNSRNPNPTEGMTKEQKLERGIGRLREKLNWYCAENHGLKAALVSLSKSLRSTKQRLNTVEGENIRLRAELSKRKGFKYGFQKISGHPTDRVVEWRGMPTFFSDDDAEGIV